VNLARSLKMPAKPARHQARHNWLPLHARNRVSTSHRFGSQMHLQ
jgi:hypothetical protein